MATTKALELGQFGTDLTVDDSTGAVTIANDVTVNAATSTGIDDNADQTVITIDSNELVTLAGALDVNGSEILVGTNNSRFAENNLRFLSSSHAYVDHSTVGQNINFRVSNASALDTTALILSSDGNATFAGELRGPSLFIIDPSTYDTDSDAGSAAGTVRIRGDLIVDGDTTTINSTTLTVADLKIVAAEGATVDTDGSSAAADGAGLYIGSDTSPIASLSYDDTRDGWAFDKNVTIDGSFRNELSSGEDFYLYRSANSDLQIALGTSNVQFNSVASFNFRPSGTSVNKYTFTANDFIINGPNVTVGMSTAETKKLSVNVTADADGVFLYSNSTEIGALARTTVGSTVVPSLDGVAGRDIHIGGRVNTDVILANAGGNVGIGTDSPSATLQVGNLVSGETGNVIINSEGGNPVGLKVASRVNRARIQVADNDTSGFIIAEDNIFSFGFGDQASNSNLNITNSNNVGIGTTTPAHKLDVNGAIGTSQVRHSIRPTLNLDFANSKAIPSDLFFYRNSTGTYYDKTGILRYAQHNVPRFDHDPDTGESLGLMIEEGRSNLYGQINGAYNPQNTSFVGYTMAPDGTMSASMHMITGDSYHRVQNNMNLTDGVSYRFSIYMKLVEGSDIVLTSTTFQAIDIGGGGGSSSYVAFERAVPVGNGWYRIEFEETTIDATSLYVTYLYINESGTNNYNANNNVVALWGGQLEEGGYSSSYIPRILKLSDRNSRATYYDKYGTLRTAPKHTPRYGYRFNGKRWIETGLIKENEGINLIDQSENFTTTVPSGSAWNTVRASIIENSTQAPDGTDNASQLTPAVFTNSDGYTRYYESFTSGQFYTFTIYAKAGDYTWFNIVALDNNGANPIAYAWFDVSNGVVGTTTDSGGLIAARIENVDNGWYRCALMFEAQQTATGLVVITPQTSDGGTSHTSDGAGGIHIWGAMLEAQDSISSYIRTVGGNATRIADNMHIVSTERPQEICRYEISNDWWNYNEGTFYAHAVNAGGNPRIFYASNFASTQRMGMYISGNDNARFLINDGSTSFDSTSAATYGSRGDELKIAGAFTAADVAVSDNGTTPITSTSSSITIPQNMTYVNIGAYYNSIPEGSIWIKKFAYYPEQLTDAEVQALSEND